MSVTENLMLEHQLILKYLDLMERYAQHPDKSRLITKLNDFVDFIHEFADTFHHAKEENILFRYLAQPKVLTHCNPIPQMLYEHNKGRELVQLIKNHHDLTAVLQYIALLREHIFKEDNILYPMAEQSLSNTNKDLIFVEYTQCEQQLNSAVIWQKYQNLYNQLTNYLD